MKKLILLLCSILLIGALTGCKEEGEITRILPYSLDEIKTVEISQTSDGAEAIVKEVTAAQDIQFAYEQLAIVPVVQNDWTPNPEDTVYSFLFIMNDGTQYDIQYQMKDTKQGRVTSKAGEYDYFTTADVETVWTMLDRHS